MSRVWNRDLPVGIHGGDKYAYTGINVPSIRNSAFDDREPHSYHHNYS